MQERRRNLAVGGFVLIGLLALGSLIVLFGKAPTEFIGGKTYNLHIYFKDVSGVRSGNEVLVSGKRIGQVTEMNFIDPSNLQLGVDVVVAIDQLYKIPTGSKASTSAAFFGQGRPPIVIASPSTVSGYLQPGDSLTGTALGPLDSIFPPDIVRNFEATAKNIGDAAEALTPVLKEMEDLLAKRSPAEVDRPGGLQGNISSAVARLDSSVKHFNEVLGDPQVKSQLRDTVANVHEMSEKGKVVMADIEKGVTDGRQMITDARKTIAKVDDSLTNLDNRVNDVSRAAVGGLDKADQFLDYLNQIGKQVTSGQGNVGRLFMDTKLYDSLLFSIEKVSAAVEDFRKLVVDWQAHGMKTRF